MDLTEKTTLPQIASERIKLYIVEHELKAGDKLPSVNQLIDMLKVSRTVVREALKTLESLGVLRIKAGNGGIFLNAPSLKPFVDQVSFQWKNNELKLKELIATRRVLELCAVEMAIEHYDLGLLEQLDLANKQMEQSITERKLPIEEDLAFHRALFKATGNQTFFELSNVLSEFFSQIRERHFVDVRNKITSFEEHKQIIAQIRKKNVDEAKAIMKKHLLVLDMLISNTAEQ
ncbi:FadR family transcriptional regulator [Paenibacillus hemerocallicola]|jgi:DNA-binding FadR family transcriptional regulator|uniref:FadR family transcriptional regulator n=1 Tax=Paenibacillus hemerocallicola TaxID=1172614 RepID=A0A5C4T3H3_9BACL|nr:FadR/GntR family transcriptional regulator [Paenibacillus hemerocallicola]TNJ63325.1 FadR family transcriptional regulator [Paenibacillus hemerocallicola]